MSELDDEPSVTTTREKINWGVLLPINHEDWEDGRYFPKFCDSREEAEKQAAEIPGANLVCQEIFVTKTLRLIRKP